MEVHSDLQVLGDNYIFDSVVFKSTSKSSVSI